ncbi:hypothetical protein BKA70DRAFT_1572980 [Coprinopsis sp. MPI-PUGE-AT-0042]|nr:hypothetical protein BKA70DRAFT_1572980 [Coprinopsis sp. MPI-PUGE-AT-0042]
MSKMGTGNAAILLFVFKPSHPEVYLPPTARCKCRRTHSEHQRSSHLLHSLERPLQIDVLQSLAYASHVLENMESPALLEPIDDRPADVQPHRLQTVASSNVKLLATLLQ